MRFMMLMIPLGYETAAPDVQLDPERVTAMMRYNEALKDAGVLSRSTACTRPRWARASRLRPASPS